MNNNAKVFGAGHRGMVGRAIVRRLQAGGHDRVMPTNLYGPNDNYDLATSHVLPALIRKAHEAKLRGDAQFVVSGTGSPKREFLYVDDLADACVHLMEQGYDGDLLNIGTGEDVSIGELAQTVMQVVGFNGRIVFDSSKPDGTPRKLLDVSRLAALGWRASTALRAGVLRAYADFAAKESLAAAQALLSTIESRNHG